MSFVSRIACGVSLLSILAAAPAAAEDGYTLWMRYTPLPAEARDRLLARAGSVVALSIPLVLAATFVAMDYFGINLQRISLGALIIALGLLVDDAMITVEFMILCQYVTFKGQK